MNYQGDRKLYLINEAFCLFFLIIFTSYIY